MPAANKSPRAAAARALYDAAGWVWVKRKALSRRRRTYLKLVGAVITAHAAPKAPIEWEVCVTHAAVEYNSRRKVLTVQLSSGGTLVVSVRERAQAREWADAVQKAAATAFEDVYEMREKIGEGAFASVHRAVRREGGEVVAVKSVVKKQFDMQMARELEREMFAMKEMRHEGVIRAHDVFNTSDKVLLVLDLMPGGTLKENVQAAGGKVRERDAVGVVRQVLEALEYLHERGIVHRDIKLENILCDGKAISTARIRVADFGYVNFVKDHTDECLKSLVGTPVYVAPEIVSRQPYGCAVDMYAVGVMVYRMLCGSYPFDGGSDDEKTMALAVEGKLTFGEPAWAETSILCKGFVRVLLESRPELRADATAALQHAWIQKVSTAENSRTLRLPASPVTAPATPVPPNKPPPADTMLHLAARLSKDLRVAKEQPLQSPVTIDHAQESGIQRTVEELSPGPDKGAGEGARQHWKTAINSVLSNSKTNGPPGSRQSQYAARQWGSPVRRRRSSTDELPFSLRQRIVSAFSVNSRRGQTRSQRGSGRLPPELSLGERFRRTMSFTRS